MFSLLKIDFRKYAYTSTFWVLLLIYFVLIVGVFFGVEAFLNQTMTDVRSSAPLPFPDFSLYVFPNVWQNLAFLGSYFKLFVGLIVLIFITNEYAYKTIRQNVMNGMSREAFLASKVLFAILLSLAATVVLFLSGLTLGLSHTEELTTAMIFEKISFIPAYFLELLTFSMMAMFAGFLFKRAGIAIVLFGVYYYFLENILAFFLPEKLAAFLPVNSMSNLIDVPNSALMQMFGVNFREYVSVPDVFICIFWSFAFAGMTYLLLRNRDC